MRTVGNNMMHGVCRHCRLVIWRYVHGKVWRTTDMNSQCAKSQVGSHIPEY